MVDGQLTRMPPMVDGKPTNGTAAPAANTLAAALSQLLKIPGVSQAQATPATSPTGLPQLNPAMPALSLPDVVDGKRI
jgi:hypothetical protein